MPFKVAIVGRPNVGKSSLFNRIIGDRLSITDDMPGVTSDRIYAQAEWLTKKFSLIDTGGIDIGDAPFLTQIKEQAEIAMDEADVIVFVVDGLTGLTDSDYYIAKQLYRTDKPVVVAVNKIDDVAHLHNAYEFYALGFQDPIAISSHHGIGIGDLLDQVISHFNRAEKVPEQGTISFAVIGRPNVGKSSLVNAILGEERVIVSNIAGTTRDAIDTQVTIDGRDYVMIDTAGMRKRGKVYESTEKYSVLRALRAIERSDVVLVVLNGEEGIIEQDKRIAGYAHEAGRAVIIVVNKWDAVEKDEKTMREFEEKIRDEFQFLDYAPIVFLSAKTKKRIHTLIPMIEMASENHVRRVETSVLNDIIMDAVAMNPTP